jgi:hypothetical protein
MSRKSLCVSLLILFVMVAAGATPAQTQTVGLFQHDSEAFDGYTLFHATPSTTTHLIDNWGRLVHSWQSEYNTAMSVYLLENGNLLRTGKLAIGAGAGGLIQKVDWDGTVLWEYEYISDDYLQHHDIEPMPNGNVLILAWEYLTDSVAIAAGRDPALLSDSLIWPEHLVEVQPIGTDSGVIVWEWHLWDHIIQDFDPTKPNYGVVADHPELIDLNLAVDGNPDWVHGNSVDYNPDLDQVVLSLRRPSEFWVIDHSTTTSEAAGSTGGNSGMGGDIIYRWGNPQVYGAGTVDDQILFYQHDVHWIEPGLPGEGNILVFNNGTGRPDGNYSTVDEITTPVDEYGSYPQPASGSSHGPSATTWTYKADPPEDFFGIRTSGAQRLPNGNTLICIGPLGEFFEVTVDGEVVWRYKNPDTRDGLIEQGQTPRGSGVFRCLRYAADYAGLAGRDLTPGLPLEIYPVSIENTSHTPVGPASTDSVVVTTKVFDESGLSEVTLYVDTGDGTFTLDMFDDGAHHDGNAGDSIFGSIIPPVSGGTDVRYYVYARDGAASETYDPFIAPGTSYRYFVSFDSPHLTINEFLAVNASTNQDQQGDYDSWIELINITREEISVSGMYLTDDFSVPDRFALPDTILPDGGMLLIWADEDIGDGTSHASFLLDSLVGQIAVVGSDMAIQDSISYGTQTPDMSYGRYPDGEEGWQYFEIPTPGATNNGCVCGNYTGGSTGNTNCSEDGKLTLSDIMQLIDHVFISKSPLCCLANGNVNGSIDGRLTLSDITSLIDNIYISKAPTADCL